MENIQGQSYWKRSSNRANAIADRHPTSRWAKIFCKAKTDQEPVSNRTKQAYHRTHVNKLIRQPIKRELAPPREPGEEPREADPRIAIRARRLRREHILLEALEQHRRRAIERALEHVREVCAREDGPRLCEQREEWRVE